MQNDDDSPSIEDTIRATLQAINARNGTNYFMPAPQTNGEEAYTLGDSSLLPANQGGADTMDPSAVTRAFQPYSLRLLPLPGQGSGYLTNLPSSQMLANALMAFASPPDPLEALRPYIDSNQVTSSPDSQESLGPAGLYAVAAQAALSDGNSSKPYLMPGKDDDCPAYMKKIYGGCSCAQTMPGLAECLACCSTAAGQKRSGGLGRGICSEQCYRRAGLASALPLDMTDS